LEIGFHELYHHLNPSITIVLDSYSETTATKEERFRFDSTSDKVSCPRVSLNERAGCYDIAYLSRFVIPPDPTTVPTRSYSRRRLENLRLKLGHRRAADMVCRKLDSMALLKLARIKTPRRFRV